MIHFLPAQFGMKSFLIIVVDCDISQFANRDMR